MVYLNVTAQYVFQAQTLMVVSFHIVIGSKALCPKETVLFSDSCIKLVSQNHSDDSIDSKRENKINCHTQYTHITIKRTFIMSSKKTLWVMTCHNEKKKKQESLKGSGHDHKTFNMFSGTPLYDEQVRMHNSDGHVFTHSIF